jgi:hypothetical protein
MFLQQVHAKASPRISTKIPMSVFPRLFLFYRVFGCFLAAGVKKTLQKNVLQKGSCRKVFTKNSTKNPKPIVSRFLFYHVFGRFSVRGVRKHDKKYRKNKSDPSPFLASDSPTHHGGRRVFFCAPLHQRGYLSPGALAALALGQRQRRRSKAHRKGGNKVT